MDIAKILKELDIPYRYQEHEAVFTVAESVTHVHKSFPVKNLLLKEEKGDRCVLVVMKGDERLDTKKLAATLEMKKLQFAKPELLLEKLDVTPGSVSIFSMFSESAKEVHLVIDERLLNQAELGFHPNDNTKTYFIAGKDIAKLLAANGRTMLAFTL